MLFIGGPGCPARLSKEKWAMVYIRHILRHAEYDEKE
jgi:hypothetical protein